MTSLRYDPRSRARDAGPPPAPPRLRALLAAALLAPGCVQILGDFEPSPCEGDACDALWAKRFGGPGVQRANAVVILSDGSVVVAGDVEGSIDFGAGALSSAGGTDAFIARLDPSGALAWNRVFGSTSDDAITSVAVDPTTGDLLAAGYFAGNVTLGGHALTGIAGRDIFVTRMTDGGVVQWAHGVGGPSRQEARGIAVDGLGNAYVTGCMWGDTTFETLVTGSADNTSDTFVFGVDTSGNILGHTTANGAGNDCGDRISVSSDGQLLIAGTFSSSLALSGATAIDSALPTNVFAAKLAVPGAVAWRSAYLGARAAAAIGARPTGETWLVGSYSKTVDFGVQSLTAKTSLDPFLVLLDPAGTGMDSEGKEIAAFGLSGGGAEQPIAAALDPSGNLYVTGSSRANEDVFLTKVNPMGANAGVTVWSGAGAQSGKSIAIDAAGRVVIAGDFEGTFLLGEASLESAEATDIFVARIK